MLKFISIRTAADAAARSANRFPLALAAALYCAVIVQLQVDSSARDSNFWRLLLPGILGISLFIAIRTTAERANWKASTLNIARAATVILLVLLYLLSRTWSDYLLGVRSAHLLLLSHLLVAALPFARTELHRASWQFNRILFQKFLIATLFTLVLFAGISIALVAIDNLFGVDVDSEAYERLFYFLAFVFHPWFFLGNVPTSLADLESLDDYPAGLKIFGQYILIPVVTLYLAILTTYLVRVLITHSWPSGWIGWLVSFVAAIGTLALLLVHPARERSDSRWVNAYGRWFFVLLIPSVAMLMAAIWQRVEQYGVTEPRYFLAVLAFWLAGIAIYYAVTASRRIRLIPETLCIVAIVTLAGPWSAYSISASSQLSRLRGLLTSNSILDGSRVTPAAAPVEWNDRREITATLHYLIERHDKRLLGRISPQLREAAESIDPVVIARIYGDSVVRAVVSSLGINYVAQWEQARAPHYRNFDADPYLAPMDVSGWDLLQRVRFDGKVSVVHGTDTLLFTWVPAGPSMNATLRGQPLLGFPLDTLRALAASPETSDGAGPPRAHPPVNPASSGQAVVPIQLYAEGGGYRMSLIIRRFSSVSDSTGTQITGGEGEILIARVR